MDHQQAEIMMFDSVEDAEALLAVVNTPGWKVFEKALQRSRQSYLEIGATIPYKEHALEEFRHYQTLAQNVVRIPRAIVEMAQEIVEPQERLSLKDILESEDL